MSSRTGSLLPPRAMEAAMGWRVPRHEEHSDFAHCTGEGSPIDSQFADRSRTRSILTLRNDTCWETKGEVFIQICVYSQEFVAHRGTNAPDSMRY